MRTFRPILVSVAILVTILPAWAADVRAPRCLELVDAQSRVVGTVTGIDPTELSVGFFTEVDGSLYPMMLSVFGQFQGYNFMEPVELLFTTPDCTGTPYIPVYPNTAWTMTSVVADVLYGPEEGATVEFTEFQSAFDLTVPGCSSFPFPTDAVRARAVLDLGARFSRPYRVRTGNCVGAGPRDASALGRRSAGDALGGR